MQISIDKIGPAMAMVQKQTFNLAFNTAVFLGAYRERLLSCHPSEREFLRTLIKELEDWRSKCLTDLDEGIKERER